MASYIAQQHTQPSPCTRPSQSPWWPWRTGKEHLPSWWHHNSHLKEGSLDSLETSRTACIHLSGFGGHYHSLHQPESLRRTWLLQKRGLRTSSEVLPCLLVRSWGCLLKVTKRTVLWCWVNLEHLGFYRCGEGGSPNFVSTLCCTLDILIWRGVELYGQMLIFMLHVIQVSKSVLHVRQVSFWHYMLYIHVSI